MEQSTDATALVKAYGENTLEILSSARSVSLVESGSESVIDAEDAEIDEECVPSQVTLGAFKL